MNAFEKGITKLLLAQLSELYHCENQLLHALERMAQAARSPELKAALRAHRAETVHHVQRLEQAFNVLHEKPRAFPCRAVDGSLEDGIWTIHLMKNDPLLDMALINLAHKVEMMEAAAYTSAVDMAHHLDQQEVADLCMATLEEELAADRQLMALAGSVRGALKAPASNGA
ncbi:MAG: ferritin-like domain-containing protein [Flavobacteriales bacterium]